MNSLTWLSAGWNRKQAPISLFAKEKWALLSGAMQIPSSWLIFSAYFTCFFDKILAHWIWGSIIRNVGMGFPYLFQNCTTEYRFRCIKREFHEAKRFAVLEVKYPV